MEITKLDAETYAGHKFTLRYETNGYYDIQRIGNDFQITYKSFEKPQTPTLIGMRLELRWEKHCHKYKGQTWRNVNGKPNNHP